MVGSSPRHRRLISIFQRVVITGVIPVVCSGTRLQLVFGLLASGLCLLIYLRYRPYRTWLCNALQLGVQLQVFLNYAIAGSLYYVGPAMRERTTEVSNDVAYGTILFVANIGCFVMLVCVAAHAYVTTLWAQTRGRTARSAPCSWLTTAVLL